MWAMSYDEYGTSGMPYDEYAKWDRLEDTIDSYISSSEMRFHFHDMGDLNGVNH